MEGDITPLVEGGGSMNGFISALNTGVTSDTLWTEITKAAPFVITIFIVAVGYRVLRRVISKGSKLKAGI